MTLRARLLRLLLLTFIVHSHIKIVHAANTRVAILPLRDAAVGGAAATRIESGLVGAVEATPGFAVANLAAGKVTSPRKIDARLEAQPSARALALAKECGAARAIAVEATPLGDGLVVYLQAIEVPSGRALDSTTVSLGGSAGPGDREALRAALVRILDPERYVGRLAPKLDVQGTRIEIDGKPVGNGTIELPVGTHALRGTHPAYHDFLRFVDIEFDKTLNVDINMAMYPLAEGEMTERARKNQPPVARKKLPWWRTWWALSLSGVIITGVTIGAVFLSRPGVIEDATAPFKPMPAP